MKRFAFLLTLFLALPLTCSADPIGTGTLDVDWSGPYAGPYYGDYDGLVGSSNPGIATKGFEEIFCVENQDASSGVPLYTFSTIDEDMYEDYTGLEEAVWIADHWTGYIGSNNPDTVKVEAQKAVWAFVGVGNFMGTGGLDTTIHRDAVNATANTTYLTNNWLYADNSSYQNYLTPRTPVPEPSTILILGIGLVGLAGFGRKKFF